MTLQRTEIIAIGHNRKANNCHSIFYPRIGVINVAVTGNYFENYCVRIIIAKSLINSSTSPS